MVTGARVKVTHPDDLAVVRALAADWDAAHRLII